MSGLGACATALWCGIIASAAPCGIAQNAAAVSFILGREGKAVLSAAGYALGFVAAYSGLALIALAGASAAPSVALLAQRYASLFTGPILILVGLVALGWIPALKRGCCCDTKPLHPRRKIFGIVALGLTLALSFCPTSAALFFGIVLPLAVKQNGLLLAAAFGIGAAAPVLAATLFKMLGSSVTIGPLKHPAVSSLARIMLGLAIIGIGCFVTLRTNF